MTKFVLATRNAHKVGELRAILGDRLGPHELVGLPDAAPDPVEDGATFEENALIKARSAAEFTGMPAIADDSGISVRALGGAPGIHSARYAGNRDDRENLELLLRNLEGVTDRDAAFFCAAAVVDLSSSPRFEHVVLEDWPGTVLERPSGGGGFGYDPVFRPDGLDVSAAELTTEEKNVLSHRAKAFGALVAVLRERWG